jgi:uncharacterized protein
MNPGLVYFFSNFSDLLLIAAVGFLGSFGHCAGMCSPIALAFSLQQSQQKSNHQSKTSLNPSQIKFSALSFHLWLNLGRLLSYGVIGGIIGAIAQVLVAGGQLAGLDSSVRRGIAIATGIFLILFGLSQLGLKLPKLFKSFNKNSNKLSLHALSQSLMQRFPSNPLFLGIIWGLMPCGFLYGAQIKAAETANLGAGIATMLAFGLGTLPVMVGVGIFSSRLSQDRRGQLSRLGGWLTVAIGVITLLRTGNTMTDYSGHTAMIFLSLALIARPIKSLWAYPLQMRRALGVGAFSLGLIHTLHMIDHSWGWNFRTLVFMLPSHQIGTWAGIGAMILMIPGAVTSFDGAVQHLGSNWRKLHLLAVPALILVCLHGVLIGSHYLGKLVWGEDAVVRVILLVGFTLLVLAGRSPWVWKILAIREYYTPTDNSFSKKHK